jgi:YD repeat-containing protein
MAGLPAARDLPLTVTNPAGWVTTKQYDALGRLTSVWTPGHPTSGPAEYSYQVLASAPSVVTTNTLEPAGTYLPSQTLHDSVGRVRETQTGTADGNRLVSDTVYNSDGWKSLVSDPYPASGAPSATLVAAQDSKVPSQTGYVYDGAGRGDPPDLLLIRERHLGDRHHLRRELRHYSPAHRRYPRRPRSPTAAA